MPGSQSAAAGVRRGDMIVHWKRPEDFAFRPLRSMNELRRENAALDPGSRLVLFIERDGETLTMTMPAASTLRRLQSR